MKEIVFVTSNKGKLESAKKYIKNAELIYVDIDIDEPNINDIEYIAEYKVKKAYEIVKKPCISLDAGFFIPAYPDKPNFPGAFVRRELMETIGVDGLLEKMKNVENRNCYFKECLGFYDGMELKKFFGITNGELTYDKKVIPSKQQWSELWYIFIPEGCTKTLAEMTEQERSQRKPTTPFIEFNEWIKEK